MGLFDDLVPEKPRPSGGLFEDLIPAGEAAPPPESRIRRPDAGWMEDRLGAGEGEGQIEEMLAEEEPRPRGLGPPMPTPRPEQDPFADEEFGDLATRRGQQFARGATEVAASVPESAAIVGAQADATKAEEAGRFRAEREETMRGMRERLADPDLDPKVRAHIEQNLADMEKGQAELTRRAEAEITPAEERPGFAKGDEIREWSRETFGEPDPRDTSFWAKVAEGGGNMSAFALTAAAGSVVGGPVGGLAAGAATGSALNTSAIYREAIEAGADEETARQAAKWGSAIGASEIVPIARAFKLLPPRLRAKISGPVLGRFSDIAQGAGEEAAQEYLAEVANNIVAQGIYDPERGWNEGAAEAALVGGVLGAGMGAVGTTTRRYPPEGEEPSRDRQRLSSPRLTPDDRASPIPNDVIDDGKAVIEAIDRGDPLPSTAAPAQPEAPDQRGSPAVGAVRAPREDEPEQDAQAGRFEIMDETETVDGESQPTGRKVRVNLDTGQAEVVPDAAPEAAPEATAEGTGTFDDLIPGPTAPESAQEPESTAEDLRKRIDGLKRGLADMNHLNTESGIAATDSAREARQDYARAIDEAEAQLASIEGAEGGSLADIPDQLLADVFEIVDGPSFGDGSSLPITDEERRTLRRAGVQIGEDNSLSQGEAQRLVDERLDRGSRRTSPAAPEGAAAPAPAAAPQPAARGLEVLDRSAIENVGTDAETFQYKGGADAEGVTERLRGVEEWDGTRAGVGLVYEYEDGRRVVVDGHQRLALAKRTASQGQEIDFPVRVLREADGVSEREARAIAASKNIAEGSGTALDAAKVFRDTRKTAKDMNLPRSSQMVRDAEGLARLSDQAFGMVVNEVASESHGAIVGRLVEAEERQADVLGLLARLKPANVTQAESIVRQAREAEATETQTTLFGEEEVSANLYLERAKVLDRALKDLGRDIQTFKTLTERGDAIAAEGNVLEQDANQARLSSDAQARAVLMKQANTKGPISDALTEAARAVKRGEKVAAAARQFTAAVRGAEGEGGAGRPEARDPRDGDGSQEAEDGEGQPGAQGSRPAVEGEGEARTEPTPEGEQFVAPGVAPVSAKDREQAEIARRRDAPKTGEDTGPGSGRDDLFGDPSERADLFDAPDPDPTEAQKEAGNYRMGHLRWNGLDITIETAKGQERRGKDRDGEEWSVTMPADYGYIRRTEGKDGDHVDVYLGEARESDFVLIVNQVDADTGRFDEHKVILATLGRNQALDVYRAGFSDGRANDRIGSFTTTTVENFKGWLESGDQSKPTEPITQPFVSRETASRETQAPSTRTDETRDVSRGTSPERRRAEARSDRIEDFGEKIEGAAKDRWRVYADKLGQVPDADLAAEPLSKSFPAPDYEALIADGVDPWTVAFIRSARDMIPTKPSRGWKLKGWVDQVAALRKFSTEILDGTVTRAALEEKLADPQFSRLRERIMGSIDLYMAVGHGQSLKGVTLHQASYSIKDGKVYDPPLEVWEVTRAAKKSAFSNMPRVLASAKTKDSAINIFKRTVGALAEPARAGSQVRFDIYRKRGQPDTVFIGKKIGRDYVDLETFESVEAAREYLRDNREALAAKLERMKDVPRERRDTNSPRVGTDYRNGADVTPEQFAETFGFRGVQFGNYVEGDRRQQDLNEAYDGFLDLAGILGVDPRALSLNGELGLAFGARGRGGKNAPKAHYEAGQIVINLTKRQGAGSLAHEWFHGLDNYFERMRGRPTRMITDLPRQMADGDVRPEVLEAFQAVRRAINQTALKMRSAELDKLRSKPYWATGIEMHARAFESYVIARLQDQGAANDYLANIVSEDFWRAEAALIGLPEASYPYPVASEVPAIRAAFDNLFQTIETRETDRGVAMFAAQRGDDGRLRRTRDADEDIPVGGVRYETTPEARAQATELAEALRGEMDRMGLAEIPVQVSERLFGKMPDGSMVPLDGAFVNGVLSVAMNAERGAAATVRHETIHALRDPGLWGRETGLFRPAEWKALEAAARADTARMAEIRETYAGFSEEVHLEEAIADMYADWADGRLEAKGFLRAAFERIRNALEAVANALRGAGFTTADQVFRQVAEGGVGRRQNEVTLKRWFGDSKIVDRNGEPLVVYHGTDQDIEAFDPGRGNVDNRAMYFTANPGYAGIYAQRAEVGANVMPVYLRIENPKIITKDRAPAREVLSRMMDRFRSREGRREMERQRRKAKRARNRERDVLYSAWLGEEQIADLKAQGFDGIINEEMNEIIAFDPEQIKSAFNRGTFDPADPRVGFSTQAAPVFHSPLLRAVQGAKQAKAPAKDWKAIIAKLPGVKRVEVEWIGVNEWLDAQDGQVTREALAEFIAANQVQISEDVLTGETSDYALSDPEPIEPDWSDEAELYMDDARAALEEDLGEDFDEAEVRERAEEMARENWTGEHAEKEVMLHDRNGVGVTFVGTMDERGRYDFPDLDISGGDARDVLRAANAAFDDHDGAKFEDYTEEGGDNYREILLRVPGLHEEGKNAPSRVDWTKQDSRGKKRPFVQSGHFEQENVVVHARVTDRRDASNGRVLFVEEIQSDLASKWREATESPEVTARRRELDDRRARTNEAYDRAIEEARNLVAPEVPDGWVSAAQDPAAFRRFHAETKTRDMIAKVAAVGRPSRLGSFNDWEGLAYDTLREKDADLFDRLLDLAKQGREIKDDLLALGTEKAADPTLPDTPFKEELAYQLMVKRLIREAADKGYDKLAWTPGYMQAERWGKAAQNVVEAVEWRGGNEVQRVVTVDMADAGPRLHVHVDAKGDIVRAEGPTGAQSAVGKPLSTLIGPKLASQVMDESEGKVSGQKITFPESGYAIAYDQQIRKAVDQFARKFGSRVTTDGSLTDLADFGVSEIMRHYQPAEIKSRLLEHGFITEAGIKAADEFVATDGRDNAERRAAEYLYRAFREWGSTGRHIGVAFPKAGRQVWSVEITPEMRASAVKSQPMFAVRRRTSLLNPRAGAHIPDRRVWEELSAGQRGIWSRLRGASGAMHDAVDRARIMVQDRFLPVLRAQEAVVRATGEPIPDEMNAYIAEETFSGKVGRHLFEIDEEYTKPIIDILAETKGALTVEAVDDWLYARHAAERNARIAAINPEMPDGGSGMETAEAERILRDAANGPHAARLERIGALIDRLRERTIALREEAGLITAEEARLWRNQYDHYVPLRGFAETELSEATLDFTGTGRRFNTRGQETKRALGRRSEAFSPLQSALTQAQEASIRAEKNRVGQALYRLVSANPSPMWEVKTPSQKRFFNRTTGLVETRTESDVTPFMDPNEMAVKIDGQERRVLFHDARLARAAGSVGADQMGVVVRAGMAFSRWFSAVNTMMNPEFVVTNATRDMTTAQINIRGFGEEDRKALARAMIRNWPKAFRAAYRGQLNKADTEWTRYYREYEESGAKVSFWRMEQPEAGKTDLERRIAMKGGNIAQRARRFASLNTRDNPVIGFIERTNLAIDNAVRLAAYVEARRAGWSKGQSASLSKNLTVNFNRRGEIGAQLNAFYPFFNAAIQGSQIIFRAAHHKRVRRIMLGIVAAGFLEDQVNAWLSAEDDDDELAWDKVPDWKQRRNFLLMLPDQENPISIPLPYGYNAFSYAGKQLSKVARGVKDPGDAMSSFLATAFESFSPISGQTFQETVTPTALQPVVEVTFNKDWRGRPIRPEDPYSDYGPNAYKHYPSVSEVARLTSDFLNRASGGSRAEGGLLDVSPEYIDHLTGFATGGAGRFVGRTTDLGAKIAFGESDEVTANDVPFFRLLRYDTAEWLDRDRYYRFRDEVREAAEAVEVATEAGEPVSDDIRRLARLEGAMKLTEKQLGKSRKSRKAIDASTRLSDDDRRTQKQHIRDRELGVMLRFNKQFVRSMGPQGE